MKILAKDINLLNVNKSGASLTINECPMWRQIGPNHFVFESYYDLAGMSLEEKTLFFEAATVQDVSNPALVNAAVGDILGCSDVLTSTPMSDVMMTQFITFGNTQVSTFPSFDQCIFGRNRVFSVDVDFLASNYFRLLSSNQLGSMSPTASDRVYVYRIVTIDVNNTGSNYTVMPARFLLQATAKAEPEFQYLMRLMRSYNLQNEPDVD